MRNSNPLPVWSPRRRSREFAFGLKISAPDLGQLLLRPRDRRDQIHLAAIVIGSTKKRESSSVRRPSRTYIRHGIRSQAPGRPGTYRLYIDVAVVLTFSVPGKSHEVAIRRQGWILLEPGIARYRNTAPYSRRRFGPGIKNREARNQQNCGSRQIPT